MDFEIVNQEKLDGIIKSTYRGVLNGNNFTVLVVDNKRK